MIVTAARAMVVLGAAIGHVALWKTTQLGGAAIQATARPRAILKLNGCMMPYYRWAGKNELLLFEGAAKKRKLSRISVVHLPDTVREPVPDFQKMWNELLKTEYADVDQYISHAVVSPISGALVLRNFPDATGGIGVTDWKIFSLTDGTWYRLTSPFTSVFNHDPLWSPDGKYLILITDKGIVRYQYGEREAHEPIPLPGEPDSALKPYERCHWNWIGRSGRLFSLSSPLDRDGRARESRELELREYRQFDHPALTSITKVRIPSGNYVASVAISEDEHHLAWNMAIGDSQSAIWLTDLTGGSARMLATDIRSPTIQMPDGQAPISSPHYVELHWRPGTTEVSYNAEGMLWVVDSQSK